METIDVSVSHGKLTQLRFTLAVSTTVGELQGLLAECTSVLVEHQKLIHKGRTLSSAAEATLGSLVGPTAASAGLKLTLIGATAAEVEQLEAAAQAAAKGRGRVIDDLRLLSASSSDGPGRRRPTGGLRRRQYGFQGIEVLPGLPDQDRARALLEELAEDPGVLHVMATFKWSVGALCELYPEVRAGSWGGLNRIEWNRIGLECTPPILTHPPFPTGVRRGERCVRDGPQREQGPAHPAPPAH
jgi:hypothetical protein